MNDVQNANTEWRWGDVIFTGRPAVDPEVLHDYVLLPKYKYGRQLVIETTTGVMTIAEIIMTFAEMRKGHRMIC